QANKSKYTFKVKTSKRSFSSPSPLLQGKKVYEEFVKGFNNDSTQIHFVAIFSPNCKSCGQGWEAVEKEILKKYPDTSISLQLIWTVMCKECTFERADEMGRMITDKRVTQYWDPENQIVDKFKEILEMKEEKAFKDVYFFYESGKTWNIDPATQMVPTFWGHRIPEAKKENLYKDKKIEKFLEDTMKKLLEKTVEKQ
ncbi:MAG: hypothetical protein AABZ60_09425, partial [Planctomycetota bacterium]